MAKAILITGIAGTGKTSVCDDLIKRGYKAFDIESVKGLFTMYDQRTGKPYENYDDHDLEKVKYHDWVCDKDKLEALIEENRESTTFYCGIASHLENLLPLFDKFILLVADPEMIRKRLTERTNNDFGKMPEVQEMVLKEKEPWENLMKEKGAIVVDANCSLAEMAENIIKKI